MDINSMQVFLFFGYINIYLLLCMQERITQHK